MDARPVLRIAPHRGTTAHVSSVYPCSVQGTFGYRGPYVGVDMLAGGAEFCFDPFDAYAEERVNNPNCWVFGEPGYGKSALVKCLLWRMAAVYGAGAHGRFLAVADPKGEYVGLAECLGLTVVRLAPGGAVRVNPLAPGPGEPDLPGEERVLRRADMLSALVATVLDRPLTQVEDAALFFAVEAVVRAPIAEPTLSDVAALVAQPGPELAGRLRQGSAAVSHDLASLGFALDKLLTRSLRGMFDGRSTVPLRFDGPGLVLDLSSVAIDSDALPLVMVAAAGWLSALMVGAGPPRVQVLDEAWALLANRHTACYLQRAFKLGRTYGVANICIAHRPSDLDAQADDGTATAKIAAGLLADSATKIVLRQAPDQLERATRAFGLSDGEAEVVGQLTRGRALWKLGGRSAVVHHVMAPRETALCDTDARMAGRSPEASA